MALKIKRVEKSDSAIASKQNAAERKREKNRKLAEFLRGSGEPVINPLEYKISLIHALNWYNVNTELKELRHYVNEYLIDTDRKKLVPKMNKVQDIEIRSIGILCRLKMRNQYLSDEHEKSIEERITNALNSAIEDVISVQVEEKVKVKVDKTYEESLVLCEEIEGAIDLFVKNKKVDFDCNVYLKANEVSASVSKHIADYYSSMLKDLNDNAEEGYGFTKSQFKKFVQFIESIVDACNQRKVSAKVRKPRKKKAINPLKVVSKMKYMKEYTELKLKSIKPETILDSTELWIYNTRYRKLAVYKAEKDTKLSVKGTTILGYDIKESIQVMLRKPEEFFKDTSIAKKALATGIKSIKTKPVTPNGRINEETILLGAF